MEKECKKCVHGFDWDAKDACGACDGTGVVKV